MLKLREGKFCIDDSQVFPGYTAGRSWNCWACPYFTYEEGMRVMQCFGGKHVESEEQLSKKVEDTEWTFSKEKDAFIINCDQCDEVDTIVGQDAVCGKGTLGEETVHVYALGNGSWCWDEDDTDLPCLLVRIDFTPDPGESIYDYPFKESKASPQEQITQPTTDIRVVRQDAYEGMLGNLPAYSGRRGARYQIKVLAENLTEDQILHLIGSGQACLKK